MSSEGRSGHFHPNPMSAVTMLIWVNIGVFFLQVVWGDSFTDAFALWGPRLVMEVNEREFNPFIIWQPFTYMFLHAGFGHLFFNMWGLYIFGKPLENTMGNKRFLHLYFTSGVIGGVCWIMMNLSTLNPVIGASGCVFGLMIAVAMLFPNQKIMLLIPPIPMKMKTFVMVFGGIEVFYLLTATNPRVAHIAHLGGLLGGFLFMRNEFQGGGPGFGISLKGLKRMFSNWKAHSNQKGFNVHRKSSDATPDDYESMTEDVDRILDKIGRSGLESLSARERKILESARRRFKDRNGR